MLARKTVNILEGPLLPSIVRYAVPVMLIGLVQSLFNAVDLMVLGTMADTNAVASVGATASLIHLLVNTFFGFSSGAKIVLARLLGAGEEERVKKAVSTSLILAFALGIGTAVLGFFFTPWMLRITACPAECMDGAVLYMRLYLAASPAIMLYNFGSSIISATGDSQRPLYYMLVSGATNVVLNFILCLLLPQKVAAVAIATAVSQIVGAFLILRRLRRLEGPCRVRIRQLSWSNAAFKKLVINGAPIGLSSALYPVANLQIQPQVNSFGPAVLAGNSAMISIEGIVSALASSSWSTSATVFVGQNLGAGRTERVKWSILYPLLFAGGTGILLGGLGTVFSRPLLLLFVTDEAAIAAGQTRMMYVLLPYAICAINSVLSHTIQSFGYSAFCTVNSIVSVLLFRIFWMNVVYPPEPTFQRVCLCYLVSWLLILIVNTTFTLYLYHGKFKKGTLKRM